MPMAVPISATRSCAARGTIALASARESSVPA
jgi:hypothetical protein